MLIDVLRAHLQAVEVAEEAIGRGAWASELTRFEVLGGMRAGEEAATEELLAQLEWMPVSERIARLAAELAREYRGGFSGIEDADYLIAATALELEARLLTTNVRHFPMFPGLQPAYE